MPSGGLACWYRSHGLQGGSGVAGSTFTFVAGNGVGFCGLIRPQHVKKLLKNEGSAMIQSQVGLPSVSNPQPTMATLPTVHRLPSVSNSQPTMPTLPAVRRPTSTALNKPPLKKTKRVKSITIKKGDEVLGLTVIQMRAALSALNVSSGNKNHTQLQLALKDGLDKQSAGFHVTFDYKY